MEPDYYVVHSHVEDGLRFEIVVFKGDAEVVKQDASPVFWAQGRVRITKASVQGSADALRVENQA